MFVSQHTHRQATTLKHIIKIALSINPNLWNSRMKIAHVLLFLLLFYPMQRAQFWEYPVLIFPYTYASLSAQRRWIPLVSNYSVFYSSLAI